MKIGLSGAVAQTFLNSKLTPLLVGASLVAGIGGLLTTPREEEPQIQVPMIDVAVGLPGASPKEVERRVVEPLERAIWEVPDVEYVYSVAQSDGALITARYAVGTEPELALTRLYGKLLGRAHEAPPGATPPLITLHGINEVPILTLTLSGGGDPGDGYLLRQQAAELAGELKRIPDVAETWVTGGAPRTVEVTLDPQALAARGLSAAVALEALGAANSELPAGQLVAGNRTIPVRVGHLLRRIEQVEAVVVGVVENRPVLVRDVATVTDGPADPDSYVSFLEGGGAGTAFEPAVTIAIAKREGTNAATIAHRVMERVHELEGTVLSDDVRVTVTRDYGETATEKSRELLFHILIATLGVVLLVWWALGWREALVVLVAVPVTLALTLLVYRLYGYTLNRITLFALVFAIGILVDDAIVVVENIARHVALGRRHAEEAAVAAVDEVGNPTILATFTVIAAILPMAFVSGLMGPYMRPIPVGASVAMLFSLAVAFIVTPYLAIRLLRGQDHDMSPAASDDEPLPAGRVASWYRERLEWLLASRRRRLAAYGGMAGLLLVALLLLPAKLVTVKMLPFDNKSEFQLIVDMPEGTTLERTAEVAQSLALAVAGDPAVAHVQTYAGVAAPFNFNGLVRHYFLRRGPTVADVQVNLVPKHDRAAQSHDIALRLRPAVDSVARHYGASVKLAEIPPGPPVLSTLVAEVYGPDYQSQIETAAQVRRVFQETEGVVDVDWSVEAPHAHVQAVLTQAEAARAATNPRDIARTIAANVGGAMVGLLHDDQAAEPVPIRVELADSLTASVADLAGLPIATARGVRQLGTLARFDSVPAPTPIFHKNLMPVVYVTADVAGTLESPVYAMLAMGDGLDANAAGPVYWRKGPTHSESTFVVWDGEWDITRDVFRDLGIAFAAVLVLIYVLVVAWFQSFTVPLVIMAPIPLTLIGILPAHAMTGAFFTATSMIGMIALAGIIVRNSILLVDFVQLGLAHGQPLARAVVASGLIRARPIILTALAVVIGGLVMVRDPIFQGLGMALISGALVATALTLVVIPLLYYEMAAGRKTND